MTLEAIYENGVLRLLQPLDLEENTKVKVIVIPSEIKTQQKNPSDILKSIADLPVENQESNFSGRDHNNILYS